MSRTHVAGRCRRAIAFLRAILVPPCAQMAVKHPAMANFPVDVLHLRRLLERLRRQRRRLS